MDEDIFKVGQSFNNYEILARAFDIFCNKYHHPFVIRSRSKKQIIYKCCHGIKQNSKCQGKRPNQHYYFKGCEAQINLYKGKNEHWKVTKMILDHNHETGEKEYSYYRKAKQFDENDYDTLMHLLSSSAKDSIIASEMRKKSGKKVSRKDIQNFRNKFFPTSSEIDKKNVKDYLKHIEDNGGSYSVTTNDKGEMEVLFIASETMISNYNKSQSSVIQIDISFGYNIENYRVLGFCYFSRITNKSEYASIALISNNNYSTMINCLKEFKNICQNKPSVFLVDKDFTEIKAVRDIFENETVLLCKFHVIEYMKRLISTAECQIDEKNYLLNLFKKCLYSRSFDEYEQRKKELMKKYKSINVYAEDKYVSLEEQFINNWDMCKEMWVECFRMDLPIVGDLNTIEIERSFLQYLQTRYPGLLSVSLIIKELITFIDVRLNNKLSENKQKSFITMDSNSEVRNILDTCSDILTEAGIKLFHKQLKLFMALESKMEIQGEGIMENLEDGTTEIFNATCDTCSCTFWISFNAPCHHILMLRKHSNLNLFSRTCFHSRYINEIKNIGENQDINELLQVHMEIDDVPLENSNIEKEVNLSDRGKLNIALDITKNIADILSNYGTESFNKYIEELKLIERNARNGVSLFTNGYLLECNNHWSKIENT